MSWDNSNQFRGHCTPFMVEFGSGTFSTTDTTVNIKTYLSKIRMIHLTPTDSAAGQVETLFCDSLTPSGGNLTISREVQPITLSASAGGSGFIAGNNWDKLCLGRCPVSGTLSRLNIFNVTKPGGTPLISLGTVGAEGEFINATGSPPGSGTASTITTFASTAITAGDVVLFKTTDGDSVPAGINVELEITPTPTSGLEFNYVLYGL